MSQWPRFVMFDLDGTLVDTAGEIAHSVNQTLGEAGFSALPEGVIRHWIGRGTAWLFGNALEAVTGNTEVRDSELYARWYPRFIEVYDELTGLHSQPYPGALEALTTLRAAGCQLAVVTNKDRLLSERLLDSHGMTHAIDWLVAGGDTAEGKPSPQPIQLALSKAGANLDEALFVGDSSNDVLSARRAQVPVWAFEHGYNHGEPIITAAPDAVLSGFPDLMNRLSRTQPTAATH